MRRGESDLRGIIDSSRRNRSSSQQSADRVIESRSQRRSGSNPWALINRERAQNAARSRRARQQGRLIESISQTYFAQGALLECLAQGLSGQHAATRQMVRGRAKHRGGRIGRHPRGKPSADAVARRQSDGGSGRGRRKGQSGRRQNKQRNF